MEIVNLLVLLAIGIAGIFILAFIWAAKSGQWKDLETPAYRILLDETTKGEKMEKQHES